MVANNFISLPSQICQATSIWPQQMASCLDPSPCWRKTRSILARNPPRHRCSSRSEAPAASRVRLGKANRRFQNHRRLHFLHYLRPPLRSRSYLHAEKVGQVCRTERIGNDCRCSNYYIIEKFNTPIGLHLGR